VDEDEIPAIAQLRHALVRHDRPTEDRLSRRSCRRIVRSAAQQVRMAVGARDGHGKQLRQTIRRVEPDATLLTRRVRTRDHVARFSYRTESAAWPDSGSIAIALGALRIPSGSPVPEPAMIASSSV